MIKAIIIILLGLSGLFLVSGVSAASGCRPIYGGGQNCLSTDRLSVDKKVQSRIDSSFQDNLDNDQSFKAEDILNFQIIVTNQTKKSLKNMEVKDVFPGYLTFVSGPGTYDERTRSLTLKISELKANETKKYVLVARVNKVPQNVCLANYVAVKASNLEADDTSKFCLEESAPEGSAQTGGRTTKGGLPVMKAPGLSQTPPTGPELISLLGLIPAALAGIFLRKKA